MYREEDQWLQTDRVEGRWILCLKEDLKACSFKCYRLDARQHQCHSFRTAMRSQHTNCESLLSGTTPMCLSSIYSTLFCMWPNLPGPPLPPYLCKWSKIGRCWQTTIATVYRKCVALFVKEAHVAKHCNQLQFVRDSSQRLTLYYSGCNLIFFTVCRVCVTSMPRMISWEPHFIQWQWKGTPE